MQRQLGHLYARDGMFEEQQTALAKLYELPDGPQFGPAKKRAYWSERFDGMLNWVGFNTLKMPEEDFGKALLSDPNDTRMASWKSFLKDFKVAYPDVAISETVAGASDFSAQLKAIKGSLQPK